VVNVSLERISGRMIQFPSYIEHLQIMYPEVPDGCRENQEILYRTAFGVDILDDSMIGLVQDCNNRCLQMLVLQFPSCLNNELLRHVFEWLANLWHDGSTCTVFKIKLLSGRSREEIILFDLMFEMILLCPPVQITVEYPGTIIDKKAVVEWRNSLIAAEKSCTFLHLNPLFFTRA
jgi:hypothetical protein